ncbi:TIR domain-containing adapter molecule 1 [Protopterus annectens]|uniref:TIR domain-containing adapter molecule 1 n=1 Tax=Protopterus annectens TaxID=7888 RepID=UPI001CFBBFED|nr:TIR domain-containing adapter molecule 1 [Protopterus annectens]XP_043909719.1 TIR domain-containing adapter molecule 1 [Protopterus annectens]XP_043909720.1 TIR domain-containing adapter molecule 1 [Protopterus annectens]XP_043909721.1 TIR domain-containing adapter molecule 1 [Protopterus annectens]
MEKGLNSFPRFENIFTILSSLTQERLQSLQHKLENSCTPSSQQLHAIILLILREPGYSHKITKCQNNDHTDLYNPEQTSQVAFLEDVLPQLSTLDDFVVLAQMYALLVDERLCETELRDRAYMAALQACRASGEEGVAKLQDLKSECMEKCGQHLFIDELCDEIGTLQSSDCLPPSGSSHSRSEPIPIRGCAKNSLSAAPGSLHSFSLSGTEMLSSSNLQISQSPTVQFLSSRGKSDSSVSCERTASRQCVPKPLEQQQSVVQQNVNTEYSLCLPPEIQQSHNGMQKDNNVCSIFQPGETAPSNETGSSQDDILKDSKCSISEQMRNAPGLFPANPVKCSEQAEDNKTVTSAMIGQAEGISKDNSSSVRAPPSSLFAQPVNSCFPTVPIQDTCPPSLISHSASSVNCINTFFSFVILHHPEDEETAVRVCRTLEELGIKGGTTFCEEFSVPGHSPLTCIQDAVDNSAFTVLLLTRLFASRWEEYQTNIVLLNSIEKQHRYNTVIPFLPKDNPLPRREMPLHLKSLVPLDESSTLFSKKACNTFSHQKIAINREVWIKEQHSKSLNNEYLQSEQNKDFVKQLYDQSQQIVENYKQLCHMQNQMRFGLHSGYALSNPPNTVPSQVPRQTVNQPCPPMTLPAQQQFLTPFPPYFGFPQSYPCVPLNFPWLNPALGTATTNPSAQHLLNHVYPQNFLQLQGNPSLTSANPNLQSSSTPVIQIQNATNVQIGDGNQMRIAENSEEEEEDEAESKNGNS